MNQAINKHSSRTKNGLWIAVFLGPNLLFFLAFTIIPVIWAAVMSFTEWNIIGTPHWVGLQNYREIFTEDPTFWKVIKNTFVFMIFNVPISIVLAFLSALLLNRDIPGKRIYRGIFFLPVISSSVVVAVVWKWMLVPDFGLVNFILSLFCVRGPNWLTDARYAMPSIIAVSVWKSLGFNMMLFLAGLQGISDTYYEAFRMDSENWFQKTIHVTLPLLAPTTFFITTMSIINSFQVFDIVKMMTDGAPGRETSVLVHYLYQNGFKYFRMGYASALAYVLFFIVLVVTLLQFRVNNQKDFSIS